MKYKRINFPTTYLFLLLSIIFIFFTTPANSQKVEVCIFGECEDVTGSSGGSNTSMTSNGMGGNNTSTTTNTHTSGSNTSTTTDTGNNNGEFIEDTDKEEIFLTIKNLYTEELIPFNETSRVESDSLESLSDSLMVLTAAISNLNLAINNLKQLRDRLKDAGKNNDISKKSLQASLEKLQCAFKRDQMVLKKITKIQEEAISQSEITNIHRASMHKIRLSLLNAFKCKKAAAQIIDGANLLPPSAIQELNTLEDQIRRNPFNPD